MAATRTSWIATARNLLEVFYAAQKPTTRRAYEADIAAFRRFIGADSAAVAVADLIRSGQGAALEQATLYKAALGNTVAPATVNRRLAALRSLTRTARNLQKITWRLRIPPLRVIRQRDTAGPGRQAVHDMIAIAEATGGMKGPRDAAMIWLFYGLALRRGEVQQLNRQDVHLERRPPAIDVLGKGQYQRRRMTLPERVVEAVATWAVVRGDHDGPLFTTLSRAHDNARRLSAGSIVRIVKALGRAAGVETSPHGLRHTAITETIRAPGSNMGDVQGFSRHARIETLQAYYDRDADAAVELATRITEDL